MYMYINFELLKNYLFINSRAQNNDIKSSNGSNNYNHNQIRTTTEITKTTKNV